MKIEMKSIKIRDLIDGYVNGPDAGVKGYHGQLDIRPPYQREFRYDEKQQQAVVYTILKGFPVGLLMTGRGPTAAVHSPLPAFSPKKLVFFGLPAWNHAVFAYLCSLQPIN